MTHDDETVPPLRVVKDDLVARLRGRLVCYCAEAADEIERLRNLNSIETAEAESWFEQCEVVRSTLLQQAKRAEQAEARLAEVRRTVLRATDAESVTQIRDRVLALLDGEAK